MTDRWVPVQGGPSTLLFTINDLYGSAAVCVKNRSMAKAERVSVHIALRPTATVAEREAATSSFTVLCDPNGANTISGSAKEQDELAKMILASRLLSQSNGSSSGGSNSNSDLGVAPSFALIPPDTTVVAAVISPRISSANLNENASSKHKLPEGLVVQVFSVLGTDSAKMSIAEVTLSDAEMKSREIDQWLKNRRSVQQ